MAMIPLQYSSTTLWHKRNRSLPRPVPLVFLSLILASWLFFLFSLLRIITPLHSGNTFLVLLPSTKSSPLHRTDPSTRSTLDFPFLASTYHDEEEEEDNSLHAKDDKAINLSHASSSSSPPSPFSSSSSSSSCDGKRVFIAPLPPAFNEDLLRNCRTLSVWTDMCPHIANFGLGQPIILPSPPPRNNSSSGSLADGLWFSTNQFTLEVIFHERMKQYSCLTDRPTLADAIYVPFYAGFEMSRNVNEQNLTRRDELGRALARLLQEGRLETEWSRFQGRDHFLVVGRIAWDFLRESDHPTAWGNSFLTLPQIRNMSTLLIEALPWQYSNQHSIPYPSYFHPSSSLSEVLPWQSRVRQIERPYLFAFVGALKKSPNQALIRTRIINQCSKSKRCNLMRCDGKQTGSGSDCYDPSKVMKLLESSVFCLQPPGDSFTRRSTFDAVLAGCIPVFFDRNTVDSQYKWHLPSNPRSFSIFIDEKRVTQQRRRKRGVSIESILLSIPPARIKKLRDKVVDLIPSLLYANPTKPPPDFRDAFTIALEGVISKISKIKSGN